MKDPRAWIAAITLAAIVISGCGSGHAEAEEGSATAPAPSNATAEAKLASQTTGPVQVQRRVVIRNGSITVRVEDIEKSERDISGHVAQIGGYVDSSESTDLSSVAPSVTMKLRVPVGEFDAVLGKIESLGHRLAKSIKSEDVSTKIVDFDARLRIMRAQEESILKSLRGLKFEESYGLQEKLMQLRAEIESITAQRKELAQLAALSTIDVTLVSDAKSITATADPNWAKESYNAATSMFGAAIRTFGSIGIFLLVLSPFWVPVVWFIWRTVRRPQTAKTVPDVDLRF